MTELSNAVELSVIITVYNIEKYIAECLDSVLRQQNIEIEVICVDDASTDQSLNILEQYSRKDCRVRIIQNEINLGQASSRNRGCRAAKGRYLYVIDGDDYLVDGSLKMMYEISQENQLDLLTFEACSFWNQYSDETKDEHQIYVRKGEYQGVYSGPQLFSRLMANNDMLGNVCLNFYRRDFFERENLYWTENARYNEDSPFAVYLAAKRAMCVHQIFYMRRCHSGSVTRSPMKMQYVEGQIIQFLNELMIWNKYEFNEEINLRIELYFKRFHREIKRVYRLSENKDYSMPMLKRNKMAYYIYRYLFQNLPLCSEMLLSDDINKLKNAKNIIVYGAGNIAHDLAELFQYYGIDDYMVAVSRKKEPVQYFKNKEIYEIHLLTYLKETAVVVIATTQKYSSEMYRNAGNLGFSDLILLKGV